MDTPIHGDSVLRAFPELSSRSLTRADLMLVFRLVGLGAVNLLQTPPTLAASLSVSGKKAASASLGQEGGRVTTTSTAEGQKVSGEDVIPGLAATGAGPQLRMEALLEAVRKGRVLLLNILQAIALFCVALFSMALWPLAAELLPVGVPPTLPPDMALLFLFVYIPLLLLSVIVSPAPPNVLKITPRKNVFNMSQEQERRFTLYLLWRAGFTMVAIYVVGWLCAASAKFDTSDEVRFYSHLGERVDILNVNVDSGELRALRLVQDVMSLQALVSFIAHA